MKTIFPHPQWNGNIYDGYDIALAQLQDEVKNVTYLRLPHKKSALEPNTKVLALGWGLSGHPAHGDYRFPDSLRMAKELTIVHWRYCPGKVGRFLKLHMICAYSHHQHVCKGKWHPD